MLCNFIFFIFLILLFLYIISKSTKLKGGTIKNFSDIDIYYINLDRSKDRLEHINTQLNVNNLNGNRFAGVDGKLLDNNIINQVNESCINNGKRKLLKGEIGCYFSHINLWKEWKNNSNNNKLLILEDDIIFVENFNKKLKNILSELPKDWDVLLLGWNKRKEFKKYIENENISENLQKTICPTFGCTGYMINKSFINKIKKYTKIKNIYMPIDLIFHETNIDLNIYNSKEKIIISKPNNVSTIDRPKKWIQNPDSLDKPQHTLIKGGNKILKNSLDNYFIMKNNFDLHKNQILITCSLFLTKTDSIKKQNKYINGLKKLYNWTNKHNYILRIYYDNSVEDIINKNYIKHNIQLFKYHFPHFFDKELNKHYGTFGTLIRFLPFFDIEHHKSYRVLSVDIDIYPNLTNLHNYMIRLSQDKRIKEPYKFFNRFGIGYCYKYLSRFKESKIENLPYTAGAIYLENLNFPINIFTNFINNCLLNNCNEYKDFSDKYQYGVDEHFLNHDLHNYIKKKQIILYNISNNLYQSYIPATNKDNKDFIDQFLKEYKVQTTFDTSKYNIILNKLINYSKKHNKNIEHNILDCTLKTRMYTRDYYLITYKNYYKNNKEYYKIFEKLQYNNIV